MSKRKRARTHEEQEHRARTLAKSAALSAAFDGAMITEGQGLLRALLAELDRLRGASIVSDGNWMQDAVRRFHVAMKQPHPETLDLESVRVELRAKLILEEALETVHALGYRVVTRGETVKDWELVRIHAPNWPEAIDGMCDTIYVVLGTAVEAGFKLAPFFAEVQRSNMTKVGGPVREDGKVLKPDTWEPPRIKYLWARVLTRAQRGQKTA